MLLFFSGNTVRLAPEDGNSPIRTFYLLRLLTKQVAEDWADTMQGTRFVCVSEDRDVLSSSKTILTELVRQYCFGVADGQARVTCFRHYSVSIALWLPYCFSIFAKCAYFTSKGPNV